MLRRHSCVDRQRESDSNCLTASDGNVSSVDALLGKPDIFWLKDASLEESANLPAPEIIAAEIAEDLEAALEQFATIAADLKPRL
jgi:hypothetical protein